MPAVTYSAIRDSFISPAHRTKPERRPLPEGSYTKGGVFRHVAIFNIRSPWQDPDILLLFFVVRVYHEKLGRMPKSLVPKFRPHLSARLKDIAGKQVPAKLKPRVVF